MVVGAGEPRLVAYVVAPRDPPSLAEARRAVWDRLPGYAWPAAVVTVPALPRRPDGSADRLALSAPQAASGSCAGLASRRRPPSPVPGGRPVARRMATTTGSNSPSSTPSPPSAERGWRSAPAGGAMPHGGDAGGGGCERLARVSTGNGRWQRPSRKDSSPKEGPIKGGRAAPTRPAPHRATHPPHRHRPGPALAALAPLRVPHRSRR